jgi:hypothetical protein
MKSIYILFETYFSKSNVHVAILEASSSIIVFVINVIICSVIIKSILFNNI